jgi:hypothetical protein
LLASRQASGWRAGRGLTPPSSGQSPASRRLPLMSIVRLPQVPHLGEQSSSCEPHRSAMLAFLIGGISAILLALWWLFPEYRSKSEPVVGRLEVRYRAEVDALLRESAIASDASGCTYYPKLLVLACDVSPTTASRLRSALQRAGWSSSSHESSVFRFTRGRDVAHLRCNVSAVHDRCEFSLKYSLNSAPA